MPSSLIPFESLSSISTEENEFIDRYKAPTGYLPWGYFAKHIIAQKHHYDNDDPWFKNVLQAPAYYLTDELYQSLINTDIKITSPPNLVNHSFFVFTSAQAGTGPDDVIAYTHVVCNYVSPEDEVDGRPRMNFKCDVACSALHWKGIETDDRDAIGQIDKAFRYDFSFNWDEITQKGPTFHTNSHQVKDVCCSTCTSNIFDKQVSLIANLILLMNVQPDIVTREKSIQSSRGRGFKQSTKETKVRTINWIGKGFTRRITTEYSPASGDNPKRSVCSHWRRGHWRTVRQGPGRKQTKMKWIQPVFVIGNRADSSTKK
tara:strand:+ start:587 stop:1534 length:948 start_codon:yes stop_codon:yes gene_type:complete